MISQVQLVAPKIFRAISQSMFPTLSILQIQQELQIFLILDVAISSWLLIIGISIHPHSHKTELNIKIVRCKRVIVITITPISPSYVGSSKTTGIATANVF